MRRLRESKRYALAAALLRRQVAKALDELTEMFLRRMHTLHHVGEEALATYRRQHQEQTDTLINLLYDVTQIVIQEHTPEKGWAAIVQRLRPEPATIVAQCEAHRIYTGNNYFPFLLPSYRSHRALFFHFVESVTLKSSTHDRSVETAIAFALTQRTTKGAWVETMPELLVSWIPEKWWRLVTGHVRRGAAV